jgi:hypothetical protein
MCNHRTLLNSGNCIEQVQRMQYVVSRTAQLNKRTALWCVLLFEKLAMSQCNMLPVVCPVQVQL